MRIELDFSKSVEQNAQGFFEKSKKAKKKLAGVVTARKHVQEQLEKANAKASAASERMRIVQKRKKEWFEKFHWAFTSDGLLIIGGRDAKSNEQIIKKFFEKDDLFFHADIFGAPHCVLKSNGKSFSQIAKQEAAQFAGVFSKAWESGSANVDVYSAMPDQVTKTAPTGESIGKGAFMVYGKREWFRGVLLEWTVGLEKIEGGFRVVSGSNQAVSKTAEVFAGLVPGEAEKSRIAKQLLSFFEKKTGEKLSVLLLDELLAHIPNGKTRGVV